MLCLLVNQEHLKSGLEAKKITSNLTVLGQLLHYTGHLTSKATTLHYITDVPSAIQTCICRPASAAV